MAKDERRSSPPPVAANDDDRPPFDQARFNDAEIAVARLIGRQMARDTFTAAKPLPTTMTPHVQVSSKAQAVRLCFG